MGCGFCESRHAACSQQCCWSSNGLRSSKSFDLRFLLVTKGLACCSLLFLKPCWSRTCGCHCIVLTQLQGITEHVLPPQGTISAPTLKRNCGRCGRAFLCMSSPSTARTTWRQPPRKESWRTGEQRAHSQKWISTLCRQLQLLRRLPQIFSKDLRQVCLRSRSRIE